MQVMCKLHIVHIDESAAVQGQQGVMLAAHAQRLLHFVRQRYPLAAAKVVNLETVYEPELRGEDASCQMRRLLDVRDSTSRQDILELLRAEALMQHAADVGCNKIVHGDSATLLASKFLAAAAKVGHLPGVAALLAMLLSVVLVKALAKRTCCLAMHNVASKASPIILMQCQSVKRTLHMPVMPCNMCRAGAIRLQRTCSFWTAGRAKQARPSALCGHCET